MKKIILGMLLFIGLTSYSQTTMLEYNYMTSGYIIQVKSGQDINKGYRVESIGKYLVDFAVNASKRAKRISEFYSVYNENSARPTEPIGTLIKMYRSDVVNDTYYFMPNKYAQADVLSRAVEDYTKTFKGDEVIVNYTWNMMRMISSLTTK